MSSDREMWSVNSTLTARLFKCIYFENLFIKISIRSVSEGFPKCRYHNFLQQSILSYPHVTHSETFLISKQNSIMFLIILCSDIWCLNGTKGVIGFTYHLNIEPGRGTEFSSVPEELLVRLKKWKVLKANRLRLLVEVTKESLQFFNAAATWGYFWASGWPDLMLVALPWRTSANCGPEMDISVTPATAGAGASARITN